MIGDLDFSLITTTKQDVKPGDTITLNYTVAGDYDANYLVSYLTYDSTVLTLVSATPGEIGGTFSEIPSGDGNERTLMYLNDGEMSGDYTLGTLTFTVASTFKEATVVEVTCEAFGIEDELRTFTAVEVTTVNGVVTPASTTPNPPHTGAISLAGLGIVAILSGAGVVLFRRKED